MSTSPDSDPPVTGERALSQAGIAAFAFAVTVATIAGAGFLLMQTSGDLEQADPVLSVTAEPVTAGDCDACQRVRLEHRSGASVQLERLELVVTIPDHDKQARLRDVPTSVLDQGDYTGHHVFTLGDVGIGGVADADSDTDDTYDAGDVIEFRIEPDRVPLRPGDRIVVSIHDGESERRLAETDITVVE